MVQPDWQPGIQILTAVADRREHPRQTGPLDAWRLGTMETPVRVYDISQGGCFINWTHQQRPGVTFNLKIFFPFIGWLLLRCETLYHRPGAGYAVRFFDVDAATAKRLDIALHQLAHSSGVHE